MPPQGTMRARAAAGLAEAGTAAQIVEELREQTAVAYGEWRDGVIYGNTGPCCCT